MNVLGGLQKPEYRSNPGQIFRRVWRGLRSPPADACVALPWGSRLNIRPRETIGRQIWDLGVFDLIVSECLWRLVASGETAFDVGGNIGYTASILATRVGIAGRVHVFEPHPELARDLTANTRLWKTPPHGKVTVHALALGAAAGPGWLNVPEGFEVNRGLSSASQTRSAHGLHIDLDTLDRLSADHAAIGVMKIDVEGGELDVLRGGPAVLAAGKIRDIVFEDHGTPPMPVGTLLQSHGYEVFSLSLEQDGPVLTPVGRPAPPLRGSDSPSYLATKDSARAIARLRPRGWCCLGGRAAD